MAELVDSSDSKSDNFGSVVVIILNIPKKILSENDSLLNIRPYIALHFQKVRNYKLIKS